MRSFLNNFAREFKAFALRGNVVDMAVGIVIGAAFGRIVSSLVDSIIMPLIGLLLGGVDLQELSIDAGDATVAYGAFLQNVTDFVIIALSIFVAIKLMNRFVRTVKRKEEVSEAEKKAEPSEEVRLLREIRDALKK